MQSSSFSGGSHQGKKGKSHDKVSRIFWIFLEKISFISDSISLTRIFWVFYSVEKKFVISITFGAIFTHFCPHFVRTLFAYCCSWNEIVQNPSCTKLYYTRNFSVLLFQYSPLRIASKESPCIVSRNPYQGKPEPPRKLEHAGPFTINLVEEKHLFSGKNSINPFIRQKATPRELHGVISSFASSFPSRFAKKNSFVSRWSSFHLFQVSTRVFRKN